MACARPALREAARRAKNVKGSSAMKAIIVVIGIVVAAGAFAQPQQKWVTSWAASVPGPYPVGHPSAPPTREECFPVPGNGARHQAFRLIGRPTLWGREARVRLANTFGTR